MEKIVNFNLALFKIHMPNLMRTQISVTNEEKTMDKELLVNIIIFDVKVLFFLLLQSVYQMKMCPSLIHFIRSF